MVVAAVLCAVGLGLLALDTLVVRDREISELARRSEQIVSAFVLQMTEAMLADEPEQLHGLARFVAAQPSVGAVSVLDADSVVRFDSVPERIGQRGELDGPRCAPCHDQSPPAAGILVHRSGIEPRGSVFLRAKIVGNEPRCVRCHEPIGGPLGHIILELPAQRMGQELADHRVQAMLTIGSTFLVAIVVVIALLRLGVQRPLRRLLEATGRIEGGDLSVRLPASGRDELGAVSRSFNTMVDRLAAHRDTLEAEVSARTAELEALHVSVREIQTQLMRTDRLATLGEMAAAVAHEVRTPLNALVLNLHLVRRQLERLGAECVEVHVIAGEIRRIDAVIDRFLAIARFPPAQVRPLLLNPVVETVLGLLGPEARRASVRLEPVLAAPSPEIQCDEDRLRQVLINLVLNAIQAMPEGGRVWVTTRQVPPVLEVADDGPGVPESLQGEILRPFFSTKGGTGLGLAICVRLLKEQGGSIRYMDRPGGGALLAVDLPVQEVEA